MTVENQENKQEITLPKDTVDTNLIQQKVDTNLTQKPEENKTEETQEDPNWRAFREARKKDRAEREAAEKKAAEKEAEIQALKAAMEAAFAKSNPQSFNYMTQQQVPHDPYQEEDSQEIRLKKMVEEEITRREAAAEQLRIQREHQEYPTRLNQTYPDFNNVISQENRDYLDYHYPEISRPLSRLPDGYDKWSDIYHAIKKLVPNISNSKKDSARADNNFIKPKSMSSTAITQPGEAVSSSRLTEERRASNWERMQKILKGVS